MAKKPRYLQIADDLREMIFTGKILPSQQLPTEHELSKTYGVSRITSQNALKVLEEEKLIIRRQGSGTYLSENIPAPVNIAVENDSKSKIISFILPFENRQDILFECVRTIIEYTSDKGFLLTIHNSEWNADKEKDLIEKLVASNVDGIILFPVTDMKNLSLICELSAKRFPLVVMDKHFGQLPILSVTSDNFSGGYLATRHLMEKGHRNIAFLSYESLYYSTSLMERYYGYCRALVENDLPIKKENVRVTGVEGLLRDGNMQEVHSTRKGDSSERNAYFQYLENTIKEFLREKVTAIFAVNDNCAIDIMNICTKIGVKVPEDVSIIGFDDIDLAQHIAIPLTTVRQDFAEMGRRAAEEMIEHIATGWIADNRIITIPVTLKARSSVADITRTYHS